MQRRTRGGLAAAVARQRRTLTLLVCVAIPAPALGRVVAGVELPEVIRLDRSESRLVLNGAGIREFLTVDVYVAALYLTVPRRSIEGVLKLDESVSLQLHFLHSISRQRLIDEWVEILQRNQPPEALPTLQTELDRSRSFFRDVQCGDTITLDYVPGQGGRATFNGERMGETVGTAFFRAALGVWLGPRPTQPSLKELLIFGDSRQ